MTIDSTVQTFKMSWCYGTVGNCADWEPERSPSGHEENAIKRNWCREVNLKQSAKGRDRLLHTWLFNDRRTSTFRGELYALSCTPADNLEFGKVREALVPPRPGQFWLRGGRLALAAQPTARRLSRDIVNFEKSVSWREPAWCQHRLEGRILYMLGVSSKPPAPRQAARTQAQTRTQDRRAAVCPAWKSCRTRSSRRTLEPNTQTGVRSLYFA